MAFFEILMRTYFREFDQNSQKSWNLILAKINPIKVYGFQQFETIRSFGDSIYTGKINIDEVERDQGDLFEKITQFNNKHKPKRKEGKNIKQNIFDMLFTRVEK